MKVVILGGYGVFGGRLARLLLADGVDVVVAGRSPAKAKAFCAEFGGASLILDRENPKGLAEHLSAGDILIDAAGPFQNYDTFALPETAIAAGAHYLDLSDDAAFTAGISTLDALARDAGVAVVSGLSSVPAISSAAVEQLREGIAEITLIESAILPGNRAPRGRSVMAAILAQVGEPLTEWRGGQWTKGTAWSELRRFDLPKGLVRRGSPIGAPDLTLFPKYYDARSVRFFAGLELGIMHHGLQILGWLRRKRLLPPLERFTDVLRLGAQAVVALGSDEGGMQVTVAGRDADGEPISRSWRLHIGGGEGPFVPAIPAYLVVKKIAAGDIQAGARPAIAELTLPEIEDALKTISGSFEALEMDTVPLFEKAIGPDAWGAMPESYRAVHDLWDRQELLGEAQVTRGHSVFARIIAAIFRFPPAASSVPVEVIMVRRNNQEHWQREFGGRRFSSTLSFVSPGRVRERFGPFEFELELPVTKQGMEMPVRKGWFMGAALPSWMLPKSETLEFDRDGRFHFSVKLSVPGAGMVVHYQGWLEPVEGSLSG